jgi:hypothetical protein
MHTPSYSSCCAPQATAPNLTVAHLQAVDRRYRPWLAMFEAGWSVDKIAQAWLEPPETVASILNELTMQPVDSPLSPGATLMRWSIATPPITYAQFREVAKAQGWSREWLIAQVRGHVDKPAETIDRLLKGVFVPAHGQGRGYTPAHWDDLADTVIPYRCLIALYQCAAPPAAQQTLTPEEAREQHAMIRARYEASQALAEISRFYPHLSLDQLTHIVSPCPHCYCGCGLQVKQGRKWASPGCRKRVQRRSLTPHKVGV